MKNKKIVRICFIVILSIIFFTCLEIAIRNIHGKVTNVIENKEKEKEIEKIYNSEKEVERRAVNKFVENVLKAIEEKDYNYVIHYIDEAYYKCFFDSDEEKLKSFLESYLISDFSYQVADMEKSNYKYFVRIVFSKENVIRTKVITVQETQNENYKILFDRFDYIATSSYLGNSNGLTWSNTYKYADDNARVFPIEIYNYLEEEVNVEFDNVYAIGVSGSQKRCNAIDSITLEPKERKQIELILIDYSEVIAMFDVTFKVNKVSENVILEPQKLEQEDIGY